MVEAGLRVVLLSGGSGTRLWPLSREAYPKQFLPMVGEDTMLQATWRRIDGLANGAPIVVANEEHRFLVAEQLRQAGAPVPATAIPAAAGPRYGAPRRVGGSPVSGPADAGRGVDSAKS